MNKLNAITLATTVALSPLSLLPVALIHHQPIAVRALMMLPACQYEDGNPDGEPCFWTDPDTGRKYYVTSEEYRLHYIHVGWF